jgi:hypothetical protein
MARRWQWFWALVFVLTYTVALEYVQWGLMARISAVIFTAVGLLLIYQSFVLTQRRMSSRIFGLSFLIAGAQIAVVDVWGADSIGVRRAFTYALGAITVAMWVSVFRDRSSAKLIAQ